MYEIIAAVMCSWTHTRYLFFKCGENIGGFREAAEGAVALLFQNVFVRPQPFQASCKSFHKMLFNSIFRDVNVTLLCTTNTPTMLYAPSPEQRRPPLSEFSVAAPGKWWSYIALTKVSNYLPNRFLSFTMIHMYKALACSIFGICMSLFTWREGNPPRRVNR